MKLQLTTWQRVILVEIIAALRGPVMLVRNGMRLLDILEISEEEGQQVGLTVQGNNQLRWTNAEHRWPIEIADRELAAFLRRTVQSYEHWPVNRAADVIDLVDQMSETTRAMAEGGGLSE